MNARAHLFVVLSAVWGAGAAGAVDVAVLPVVGPAPPGERAAITKALRTELQALGVDVQAGDVTDRTLADAATFGADCAVTDATCALQLGGVAGVDRVVVAALDGGRLILRLHDVIGQRELRRITVPSSSVAPQKTARLGAVRLLAPERETGMLRLVVDVAGAVVVVDGAERGTTPLPPLTLSPGRHALTVTHPSHAPQSLTVDITFDDTTSAEVSLREASARASAGQADTIYVLDAVVDGYPPLTAALLTATAQDALRGRDGLVVVPPDTVARVVDRDTLARLQACRDDACAIEALRPRFQQGDVLFVDVEAIGTGSRLSLRRRSLTPDRSADDDIVESISPVDPDGRVAAAELTRLIDGLHPEDGPVAAAGRPDRFAPPPVAIPWLAAPVAVGVVGLTVAAVGGVMLAGPTTDPARTGFLATTVTGGVVAAAGAIGAATMVPFIDWDDLQGDNAKLLQARADRPPTRQ